MTTNRSWAHFPKTYRLREMHILAEWVLKGMSGSVAGLPGIGKSNFLGIMCYRPEIFQTLLKPHQIEVALIPIDLNNLPDDTPATFYRVILRGFYEVRSYVDDLLQEAIVSAYQENKAVQDPFLVQSALRELLAQFRGQNKRVGFVLDRFDDFCEMAAPQTISALRGLRDSFKDTLFYLMGMRQEAAYLSDPSKLGELYEILDTHVCWLQPLSLDDARWLIARETQEPASQPGEQEVAHFLALSGSIPSLLKAICHWWLALPDKPELGEWADILLTDPAIEYRLQEIFAGLNEEELLLLSEVEKQTRRRRGANTKHPGKQHEANVLDHLMIKGICQVDKGRVGISSDLLATYLARSERRGRGRIWLDSQTEELYQGERLIEGLTPLERGILLFLLKNPRFRHSKTDLIANAWPDDLSQAGVTDDSLYQVIAGLRKKIEPVSAKPCYILHWHGNPEGGYQLFPEGRPL
ncbi:MAG TPA: helix-turn-helix domain-containing protein [Chloroflexota bacterium]|nr:helix-turn-helix domain-containing protein [Chloroflexota bacterium]HUM69909.1 helix-turn-helix domain-containing protein [Chloroflexota bacterium]